MDTTAYLTNQGWLGLGHALQPTGVGITKPLLVSHKSNSFGIGKKKHDANADQWWARAFDISLRGLEVGNNRATESVNPRERGPMDMIKAGGEKSAGNDGLYAGFVRGEGLSGTIVPEKPAIDKGRSVITKRLESPRNVQKFSKERKGTARKQRDADAIAERPVRGEKAASTTRANGQIVKDPNSILETLSSRDKRRQRHRAQIKRDSRCCDSSTIIPSQSS
ncbi:hypothetical protein MMC26_007177 [Xylographa opegraphella]|nr:hypothetical protein [Xylographa opegraphella]